MFGRWQKRKWWPILLAVWLIGAALLVLVPDLNFAHSVQVLAVLAIVAGILILIDR